MTPELHREELPALRRACKVHMERLNSELQVLEGWGVFVEVIGLMSVWFNALNGIAFVSVFVLSVVDSVFLVVCSHYSCYCSQLLI